MAENKILLFDQITRKIAAEVFGFLLYQKDRGHAERNQMKYEKQTNRR